MNDKFSLYQTDGLWGIIENTSNEKQTSIKSYFGSDLIIKRLNEQADQIDQLQQQLAEKDKEIAHLKEKDNYHLRYELAGADETITNLKQQLEEKDKENEELKLKLDIRAMNLQNINTERMEAVRNQTQLAIKELEKTKDLLLNESKNNPIIYDVNDDLVGGAIDKDAVFKIIDQQIKELKGE